MYLSIPLYADSEPCSVAHHGVCTLRGTGGQWRLVMNEKPNFAIAT
jgi:hypothetical protein